MAKNVVLTADKLRKRKKLIKYVQMAALGITATMAASFAMLSLVYNGGDFTITLNREMTTKNGIILYNNSITKNSVNKLAADKLEYMDNISINWIPNNIHEQSEGPHNGSNYIAYIFFLENQGEEAIDYWYTVAIDDVIKNVDTAVRVMIYRNGEKTVYAKLNTETNEPEPNTKAFVSDLVPVSEKVENFKVGDIDKYTIVLWLEGDDPDCTNNIIGGEIKMHMEITEEGKTGEINE